MLSITQVTIARVSSHCLKAQLHIQAPWLGKLSNKFLSETDSFLWFWNRFINHSSRPIGQNTQTASFRPPSIFHVSAGAIIIWKLNWIKVTFRLTFFFFFPSRLPWTWLDSSDQFPVRVILVLAKREGNAGQHCWLLPAKLLEEPQLNVSWDYF